MIDNARALHFDPVRVAFLQALQRRLQGLIDLLSPSPWQIAASASQAYPRSKSLMDSVAYQVKSNLLKSQLKQKKFAKIRTHHRRIATDLHLLFDLETDLDNLALRLRESPHSLVRRSRQQSHEDSITQRMLRPGGGLKLDAGSQREAVDQRESQRDHSALQKRGGALSNLWQSEQFEPTTTEPTPPFDPPRDLDETQQFLKMQSNDPYAAEIVAFHRHYDKVLDPATLPPRLALALAEKFEGYKRWNPIRVQDAWTLEPDEAMKLFRSDVITNRIAGMKEIIK